ncbi:MAG: hypothetical protein KDA87_09260 [Planctomycetales bacterium]|nr:hypothetical protein [Planctomycetales bacterium]
MLQEIPWEWQERPLTARAEELIRRGAEVGKSIDCFDFVPSDHRYVWNVLNSFPVGRFCEWGSGTGVVTGLAAILGFESTGIEMNAQLAAASQNLLHELQIDAAIIHADYMQVATNADIVFVYCWPGQMQRTEQRFLVSASNSAMLLACHGASDVRVMRKAL